jgi:hypothetical protein
MTYIPNGKVLKVEAISGPRLLSSALGGQLMEWTLKTDAIGTDLCQTLVNAEFSLDDSHYLRPPVLPQPPPPSILRLSVEAETDPIVYNVVTSDPAPLRGFKAFCLETKWKLERAFGKVFGTR